MAWNEKRGKSGPRLNEVSQKVLDVVVQLLLCRIILSKSDKPYRHLDSLSLLIRPRLVICLRLVLSALPNRRAL